MDVPATQRLLLAALAGGVAEIGALVERLRPRLVLWCAARMSKDLKARMEPEDAAQEILLAVTKDFRTYHGPADRPFFKWFFTVADHKLKDLADYHGAQKRQTPDAHARSQVSASMAAALREGVGRLRAAIDRLPEEDRLVVRLYKLEGLDVGEVAGVLRCSENAVRIRYCRALEKLRDLLGGSQVGGSAR